MYRFARLLSLLGLCAVTASSAAEGVTLRFAAGAVGAEFDFAQSAAAQWAADTGNEVVVLGTPGSTSDRLALFQQQLAAESADVDVYQIDVIWPGVIGGFFIDLSPYVTAEERAEFFASNVDNNTVDGKLVALPWFTDAGLLFYRTDLLEKHTGSTEPPRTWAELEEVARKVQEAERAENPNFWGFVWQGAAYEGLTCDALEWIASAGGGTLLDGVGTVTVNNAHAAGALRRAAGWVGTISPPGVTSYTEEEARGVFQAGSALFMRNWPYAIALGNSESSPVRGKFAVTVLPRGDGEGARNAATLGGWQLAVSRFSKHPAEAAAFVRYMTSEAVQKDRAIRGAYAPTRRALYRDEEVLAAQPVFDTLFDVFNSAVPRPARIAKTKYNRVSNAFWTSVHGVLQGKESPEEALTKLEAQLERLKGRRGF